MARALLFAAALLMAVTPAFADEGPATSPTEGDAEWVDPADVARCGIRLRRAPDDVRAAIESALATDGSACAGSLDVWIVPAEGGLYVQSRDNYGRVRERVVADAATAATLLMSWVEVDTVEPLWSPPAPAPEPVVAAVEPPRTRAPGDVDPEPAPEPELTAKEAPRKYRFNADSAGAYGMMQQMASGLNGLGYRADVEFGPWHGLQWTFEGGGMYLSGATEAVRDPDAPSFMMYETGRSSAELGVTASKRLGDGRLAFVPGLGLGLGMARHDMTTWSGVQQPFTMSSNSFGPRAELSLVMSVRVIGGLHLETGLRASMAAYKQTGGSLALPVWADSGTTLQLGLRWRQ